MISHGHFFYWSSNSRRLNQRNNIQEIQSGFQVHGVVLVFRLKNQTLPIFNGNYFLFVYEFISFGLWVTVLLISSYQHHDNSKYSHLQWPETRKRVAHWGSEGLCAEATLHLGSEIIWGIQTASSLLLHSFFSHCLD